MNQISKLVAIFFLLFSFSIFITSARLLNLPQGKELGKAIESTPADSTMQIQEDGFINITDLEEVECDEKNEDCVRRRIAEAHLDYIYTQRNKPQQTSP